MLVFSLFVSHNWLIVYKKRLGFESLLDSIFTSETLVFNENNIPKNDLKTFQKKPKPSPFKELTIEEFNKAKFKARIAFIDDEEVPHIDRLRQDGYSITHYSDIEGIDDFIRKDYQVVVLDIQGVGQNISPESEGWGILKYLKQTCPNLVVIMFTGAEWSITKYKNESDEADDFIGKGLEFLDFKSKLDSGIRKAFSLSFHFEIEKKNMLKEISNTNNIDEIRLIIETYGNDKKTILDEIKKISNKTEVLASVNNILSITENITNLIS